MNKKTTCKSFYIVLLYNFAPFANVLVFTVVKSLKIKIKKRIIIIIIIMCFNQK